METATGIESLLSPDLKALSTDIERRMVDGYPCIVSIHNRTPKEWKASIVAAGTIFYYQDEDGNPEGEPFRDIESNINIETGGSVYNRSDFPDRCVRRIGTVIFVKVPGHDPVKIPGAQDVGPRQCMRSHEFFLQPKRVNAFGESGQLAFALVSAD